MNRFAVIASLGDLVKAERERPKQDVSFVLAFDAWGRLLLGIRRDNQLFTLPGGHVKFDEKPIEAARRELKEETGASLISITETSISKPPQHINLHLFSAMVGAHGIHPHLDPDKECFDWKFIDVKDGRLPAAVYDHLHGPKGDDNVLRQFFTRGEGPLDSKGVAIPKKLIGICSHGLRVFQVNGTYVRNHLESDFDQGGNGYRYDFISKHEIWVDSHEPSAEIPYIIEHECREVERMRGGESYDDAHKKVKQHEDEERSKNRPGELGKAEPAINHDNPHERVLATYSRHLTPKDLLKAALDPHPDVVTAAMKHPEIDSVLGLLSHAQVNRDGEPLGVRWMEFAKHEDTGRLLSTLETETDK